MPSPLETVVEIRRALAADAGAIADVMAVVTEERIHSAIDQAWTADEQRHYIESLSPREAIHVAVDAAGTIIGLQVIDRWSPITSMAHAGQVGTFLLPQWRRRGVGRRLWNATMAFAAAAGYRKLVIQVRGSNADAQSFYRGVGFEECGRLARQVVIDGVDDDEVLMECFLPPR